MLKILPLISLILIGSLNLTAQTAYKENLSAYLTTQRQEKIYLHLDKPHYGAGDQVWLKAYIVDGTYHTPTKMSGTLYIDLINAEKEIIDSLLLPITDGMSKASFALSRSLDEGSYRIRAYTNWMRNFDQDFFFRKDFEIINPIKTSTDSLSTRVMPSPHTNTEKSHKKNLLVDFLPEGGDLINGIPTKVAIKATDHFGSGVPFKGGIFNDSGELVAEVESNEFGHGLFFMTPSIDSTYSAVINSDTFKLGRIKKHGASIHVLHNYESDQIRISVLSNGVDLSGGSLMAHQRGRFLFSTESEQSDAFSMILNKTNLGSGLIHLTFFTKNRIPLSERIIFPNIPSENTSISIKTDQNVYQRRSRIVVDFNAVEDSVHSASVTVNPLSDISYSRNQENIISYLLLSSDIKGRVESPSYYFNNTDIAYDALDLLMLTQGWSRFNWESLLKRTDFQPEFLPEKGINIRGQTTDYYKENRLKQADFTYIVPQSGVYETGRTDENGHFNVDGNDFRDSTMVIIQAHGFKGKKGKEDKNVRVNLRYLSPPDIVSPPLTQRTDSDSSLIKKVNKLQQISRAYMLDEKATLLDEVVVSTKDPITEQLEERTILYSNPSHRIFIDSLGYNVGSQNIFDLLRRLPGIQVSGTSPNFSVTLRGIISLTGNNEPFFVLDGTFVNKEAISSLPIQSVEFIDVLKGPKAAIYGSRAAAGAILIYTRRGDSGSIIDYEDPKGILGFMHPGYSQSKEFYSPQYDIPKEEHKIPDFRSTIFWEPDLTFNDKKAQLIFYSSDQKGTYMIQLEGMLKNGEPVYENKTIEVE